MSGGGLREEQPSFPWSVHDDDMFDMTNLSSRRTGIPGIVYASTAQGKHGPRVKWYPGRPSLDAPCLVITLEAQPRTINQGLSLRDAQREEAALVAWVESNRDALLAYWNDGLGWTEEEHDAFRDSLKPIR